MSQSSTPPRQNSNAQLFVAGLLLAAMLAGCMSAPTHPSTPPPVEAAGASEVFDGLGRILSTAHGLAGNLSVVVRETHRVGAEPSIGIDAKDAIFVTTMGAAFNHNSHGLAGVERSLDYGKTWTEVFNLSSYWGPAWNQQPDVQNNVMGNADPILWVDQQTGRVFATFMSDFQCAKMFMSDDQGATWLGNPEDCGLPGNDHPQVITAPPAPPVDMVGLPVPMPHSPTAGYPNLVYYCYFRYLAAGTGQVHVSPDDPLEGETFCAVSYDGGLTFQTDTQVASHRLDGCGGHNSPPAAASDGTVYVAMEAECQHVVIASSSDNGVTWYPMEGPALPGGRVRADPAVAITPDGKAYVLYMGSDQQPYLIRSSNGFQSYDGPWRVSPRNLTSTNFLALTAGDNGRLAMAFLGTTNVNVTDPSIAANTTRWNLYETFTTDANATNAVPTFRNIQVTGGDDPVQIGCIWMRGGGSPCRNLLDFISMTHTVDGRPIVVFSKGCDRGCSGKSDATAADSGDRIVSIAVQEEGPSLFVKQGRLHSTRGD
jgi:hypothetical protein